MPVFESLFTYTQQITGNTYLDLAMVAVAEFTVLLVPLTLVYLWYRGKEGRKTSIYTFIAVFSAIIVSYGMGYLYHHESPYMLYDTIASGAPENSFPSQHTTTVLAMTLPLIWRKRRKLGYFFLGAGVATGFARIYIGEHFPIDIIGAGVAAIAGFGISYTVSRYLGDEVERAEAFTRRVEERTLRPIDRYRSPEQEVKKGSKQ